MDSQVPACCGDKDGLSASPVCKAAGATGASVALGSKIVSLMWSTSSERSAVSLTCVVDDSVLRRFEGRGLDGGPAFDDKFWTFTC